MLGTRFHTRLLRGFGGAFIVLSAGAQLRLPASQLQARDRLAAPAAQIRTGPGAGLGQATCADPVQLLRGGDGDRANADSLGVRRGMPQPIVAQETH